MNLGIIAIIVSILCLGASFFVAPMVLNVIGLVAGVIGLVLLTRAKSRAGKGGGGV